MSAFSRCLLLNVCLQLAFAHHAYGQNYLIPAAPVEPVHSGAAAPHSTHPATPGAEAPAPGHAHQSLAATTSAGGAQTPVMAPVPATTVPVAPNTFDAASATPATAPAPAAGPVSAAATATANSQSPTRYTTGQVIEWIEKNDPLVSFLNSVPTPGWTGSPMQIFCRQNAGGYATTDGSALQLPSHQQPELLNEYKCSHILIKKFVRPQRTNTVVVYSFREPEQAFGAYTTMRTGSSNFIVRADASSEDDDSISFLEGRRFVVLNTTADEDQVSKDLISSLADTLVKRINEHAPKPALVASLPVLDKIAGSERMFFGMQAARKYVSVPFMQSLELNSCRGAAFAEYAFSAPVAERLKVLSIEFSDPKFARSTYSAYVDALAMAHKCKFVQPNSQLAKTGATYMLTSLSGNRITLVMGARHKESPFMLSRQMYY